ncbi:Dolichyl-diphosphooligosaccharide--protein glycosyltransferase subunit DAD1-like protein [Drosera capensis]
MTRSTTSKDAQALFHSLLSAYAATPTNLKIIDWYVFFAVFTALIQVNKENKEFKDLPPQCAVADFVLCILVLNLVIMNFFG